MPSTQPQETEPATPKPTREQRLEAALRDVQWLAAEPQGKGWNLAGLHASLSRIENKCREALGDKS